MKIVGVYSFNGAKKAFASSSELEEVKKIISHVKSSKHKTKISKEKTMPGRKLYKPDSLNKAFTKLFTKKGWNKHKVPCEYPTEYYQPNYKPKALNKGAFREMDFVKNKIGVEVQFGKYAFMVYNVCAKMTIFHNLGIIDKGIEIVPVKEFADEMSTGVSYFEQLNDEVLMELKLYRSAIPKLRFVFPVVCLVRPSNNFQLRITQKVLMQFYED